MKLKSELEKLLIYLNQSTDSVYAHDSIFKMKVFINETIKKIDNHNKIEINKIKILIVPTGSLQEISIDNNWGQEFVIIANEMEKII